MANQLRRTSSHHSSLSLPLLVFLFLLLQTQVHCYQYKVGDLDAWGTPTSANPQVYDIWSKYHPLKIGDSLLFLYPPSQDSVIQVTQQAYDSCNTTDPILYMNDGNSVFNITSEGVFFFTSGVAGRCQKKQKLRISVGNGTSVSAPSPSSLSEIAPSYPTVFGSIPAAPSASVTERFPVTVAAAVASVLYLAIWGSGEMFT